MAHKEDAKDPVITQLVWIAYEKVLTKKAGANTPAEKELAWLAEEAPNNEFVRDQIVPKAMRRLVATGQPGDLKLCIEFIAKLSDSETRLRTLTNEDTILGTPCYLSPEQCGTGEVGPRSDVYSLGILVYEMVAGDVPFDGASPSCG